MVKLSKPRPKSVESPGPGFVRRLSQKMKTARSPPEDAAEDAPEDKPGGANASALLSPPVSVVYIRPPTPASPIPQQAYEEWGPTKHTGTIYQLARYSPSCRACILFQEWRSSTNDSVDKIYNEAKHPRSSKQELPAFIRHRWTGDDTTSFKFFHSIQTAMDTTLRQAIVSKNFTEYRELERMLANFKEDQVNKRISTVLVREEKRWVRREKWELIKAKVRWGMEVVASKLKRDGGEERVVIRDDDWVLFGENS